MVELKPFKLRGPDRNRCGLLIFYLSSQSGDLRFESGWEHMARGSIQGKCKRCGTLARVLLRVVLTIAGRKVVEEDLCENCAAIVGNKVIDDIY